MKKLLSLILTLAMVLSLAPAAFATEGQGEVLTSGTIDYVPQVQEELIGQDQLLDYFLYQSYGIQTYVVDDRALEGELPKLVYKALADKVEQIAKGEDWSGFTLSWGAETTTVRWEKTGTKDELLKAAEQDINMDGVMDLLLMNMPMSLYWYDKVKGVSYSYKLAPVGDGKYYLSGLTVVFNMVEGYQGDTSSLTVGADAKDIEIYKVKAEKLTAANNAVNNAAAILDRHASESDYHKLYSYMQEILALASYDETIKNQTGDVAYGDLWQPVNVFDGDKNTASVCEGYAKAFQYLCDKTDWSGSVQCYTVTGTLNVTEPHMWNIVTIDGANYLVDLTNCDEGTVGEPDKLFLAGASGSVENGWTLVDPKVSYAYDLKETQQDELLGAVLNISGTAYDRSQAEHSYKYTNNGDGTHSASCTICNFEINNEAHSYTYIDNGDGTHTGTCTCGQTVTDAHSYQDGSCNVCGATEPEQPHEHSYGNYIDNGDGTHTGTCTCGQTVTDAHSYQDGTCSFCGAAEPTTEPEEPQQHGAYDGTWSYDDSYHWHPCLVEGCTDAAHIYDKVGHTMKWTTDDTGHSGECTVCGYVYDHESHDYDDSGMCKICGYVKTQTPPAEEHNFSTAWTWNETQHWHGCQDPDCNAAKDLANHSFGNWTAADLSQHKRSCTVCGYEVKEDHSFDENGKCTVCGFEKTHTHSAAAQWSSDVDQHWHACTQAGCQEKLDQAKHSFDNGKVTKAATTAQQGTMTYTCTVCGYVKTEPIAVIPSSHTHDWAQNWTYSTTHHWKECTQSGCTVTDNAQKYNYGTHQFGAWRTTVAATATTAGAMERSCGVCGFKETKQIPASGGTADHTHQWGDWVLVSSPNYWQRTCTVCGARDIRITNVTAPTITSGAGSTWKQNSTATLSFTSSAPANEFLNLTIDNYVVSSAYYTVGQSASGTISVVLKTELLRQLSTGTHTLGIVSTGGTATASFTIQRTWGYNQYNPNNTDPWGSPKTGDTANMGLWIALICVSLVGVVVVAVVIAKKSKKKQDPPKKG